MSRPRQRADGHERRPLARHDFPPLGEYPGKRRVFSALRPKPAEDTPGDRPQKVYRPPATIPLSNAGMYACIDPQGRASREP